MKIQSNLSRLLKTSLLLALIASGFARTSAATVTASTQGPDLSATVTTVTHIIYPGAGIGGIGDDE